MPAIWGLAPLTGSIESDKAVRLSTGAIVDLASFKFRLNRKPPQQKLDAAVARVQASMDHIVPLASLPDDEPTKTMTAAELQARYGERVFLDGPDIVNRSTRFSLTWDEEIKRLLPGWDEV